MGISIEVEEANNWEDEVKGTEQKVLGSYREETTTHHSLIGHPYILIF
jgi:hypothetical protein